MSLTINRIGGSGGVSESNAILMVHVPTRSTVTASKGGVILTPKMWVSGSTADEDVAMFIFSPGQFDSVNSWMIEAINGEDMVSDTILIDANEEYDMKLSYRITSYYQEVEYLEKRGTGVIIDTGIICSLDSYVLVNYYISTLSSSSMFFGTVATSSSYFALQAHSNNARVWVYYSGVSLNSGVAEDRLKKWTKARCQEGQIIEILDENDTVLARVTGTSSYNPTYSISIFACHTGASSYNSNDGSTIRLGIIWLDDNELIPCYRKTDNAPGYFNAKTKVFSGNIGTGTIYLGPDL